MGFSRLWLGVHSPQDVIVGLLLGFSLVFIFDYLIKWAEKDRNRYVLLVGIIDILAVLVLIYLYYFNTYRIDYVSGKILVDPYGLKYEALILYAQALGLINGCFLCAKFVPYNPKETPIKQRIARGIIGAIIIILSLKFGFKYVLMNSLGIPHAMSLAFLIGITLTLIYPVIFTKLKMLKI